MADLWHEIGITPVGAVGVVISTTAMYLIFGFVLRVWRQRLFASPRSLDLAVVTVLGAIVGRSTMGHVPTLAGGLIALATLAVLEGLVGVLRRVPLRVRRSSAQRGRAVAIVVGGRLRAEAAKAYGLSSTTLWSALRQAGVASLEEVTLVVLEPSGRLSVVRSGQPLHPSALTGIKGAHLIIEELRASGALPARQAHPHRGSGDAAATAHHEGHQPQAHDQQPAQH